MTTQRLNRTCKAIGLLFLLATAGGKTVWYAYRGLDQLGDFPQYYMGGLIARLGEWESLYPIPNPDSHTNPGFIGNSEPRPRYRELARQLDPNADVVRYMQPPPFAILLIPLALLPYDVAFWLWCGLLIFAAWGIGLHAGRIFALSFGRETRAVGLIVLLICISPQAHRWIRVGNMSVILGWLIGYATLELVRRDSFRTAAAMVIGAVAKYAILVLGPLFLVMRRWRTIAWGVGVMLVLVGASLLVMPLNETGPYQVFFRDIAPRLGRTGLVNENQALYPMLHRMLGLDAPPLPRAWEIGFRLVQFATLGLILGLIFFKRRGYWNAPARVFAAATALVAWLIVFSPIAWEHYYAYLAPFWGWLVYEATRSRVKLVLAALAIGLSYLPTSLLLHQIFGHEFRMPEPFFSHLLWGAVIMMFMGMHELIRSTGVSPVPSST